MSRFFFNVRCGQHLLPDREGRIVPNRQDVRRVAAEHLRELAARSASRLLSRPDCLVEIADERHEIVLSIKADALLAE